jgi:hypothetical protein
MFLSVYKLLNNQKSEMSTQLQQGLVKLQFCIREIDNIERNAVLFCPGEGLLFLQDNVGIVALDEPWQFHFNTV